MNQWTVKAHHLITHQANLMANIARDTTTSDTTTTPRFASKLPGDTRSLRGIPAIGRGVQGAITGTRPGDHR